MIYKITGSCVSNVGNVRDNNEDNLFFDGIFLEEQNNGTDEILNTSFSNTDNKTFAIFDGMGGHAKGERASFISASTLKEYSEKHKKISWNGFAKKANEKVCRDMSKEKNRMGSTMAAVQFYEDSINISNLGDSRIYILTNNKLEQVSYDHTEANLSKNIISSNGQKSRLTQYIGIKEDEMIIQPYNKKIEYEGIEKLLICSDGITDMIDEKDIEKILNKYDANKSTKKLLDTALKNGGEDNTTVMVFEIKKEKGKNVILDLLFKKIW